MEPLMRFSLAVEPPQSVRFVPEGNIAERAVLS
jgi:hypothetical protein